VEAENSKHKAVVSNSRGSERGARYKEYITKNLKNSSSLHKEDYIRKKANGRMERKKET